MFASLPSNVISLLCSKFFVWVEGSGFGWIRRWKDWRKIASNYVKKALISKQTLGHFNKLALTDTFEETFNQFDHSTATFPIVKANLAV